MTMRARVVLFAIGMAVVTLFGVVSFAALPPFGAIEGTVGEALVDLAIEERNTANTVTAVMFDMRALDTLGEEAILLAAVAGTSLLLRLLRQEREHAPEKSPRAPEVAGRSPALRMLGVLVIGFAATVALLLFANGHISPGGGFQGGVVLASALLSIYLLHDYDAFDALTHPSLAEPVEAVALFAFVAVGVAGAVAGSAFLANVLPLGDLGRLPSGGTIPVLNVVTGVAVTAGLGVIIAEFAEQTLRVRGD